MCISFQIVLNIDDINNNEENNDNDLRNKSTDKEAYPCSKKVGHL